MLKTFRFQTLEFVAGLPLWRNKLDNPAATLLSNAVAFMEKELHLGYPTYFSIQVIPLILEDKAAFASTFALKGEPRSIFIKAPLMDEGSVLILILILGTSGMQKCVDAQGQLL